MSGCGMQSKSSGDKIVGYCMKCKHKRRMTNLKKKTLKNGAKAVKGKCHKCDTGMFKILGKKK